MLGNVHVHIFPLYHWHLFIFSINKPLCPAKSLHLDKKVWRKVFTSLTTQCTCHSHLWLNLWVSELGTLHLSHIVLNDLNLSLTWIWTILRSVICTILIDIDLLNHDHWKSVLGTPHFTALFSVTLNSDIVFCNPNIWRSALGISHLFDLFSVTLTFGGWYRCQQVPPLTVHHYPQLLRVHAGLQQGDMEGNR